VRCSAATKHYNPMWEIDSMNVSCCSDINFEARNEILNYRFWDTELGKKKKEKNTKL
jgi:hypothetical protein